MTARVLTFYAGILDKFGILRVGTCPGKGKKTAIFKPPNQKLRKSEIYTTFVILQQRIFDAFQLSKMIFRCHLTEFMVLKTFDIYESWCQSQIMKLHLLIFILSERLLSVLASFSCYYQGWNRGNDSMVVVECSPWAYGCITEHISKDLIF